MFKLMQSIGRFPTGSWGLHFVMPLELTHCWLGLVLFWFFPECCFLFVRGHLSSDHRPRLTSHLTTPLRPHVAVATGHWSRLDARRPPPPPQRVRTPLLNSLSQGGQATEHAPQHLVGLAAGQYGHYRGGQSVNGRSMVRGANHWVSSGQRVSGRSAGGQRQVQRAVSDQRRINGSAATSGQRDSIASHGSKLVTGHTVD